MFTGCCYYDVRVIKNAFDQEMTNNDNEKLVMMHVMGENLLPISKFLNPKICNDTFLLKKT